MSQPFVGEIRMFGGNFAPLGWAMCSGQLMPIAQNQALFALIGTTYGGDGVNTFALPNLQSRRPVHQGQGSNLSNHVIGESAGVESVTVTIAQLPSHTHPAQAVGNAANASSPAGHTWAAWSDNQYDTSGTPDTQLPAGTIGASGGNQPHNNLPPYLVVTFIISQFGIFPTQN